jgi:hypothetical protein
MLGTHPEIDARKTVATGTATSVPTGKSTATSHPKLTGYVLTTKHYDPGREMLHRLQGQCERNGFELQGTEFDVGYSSNPYRVGLWRALRRLVCNKCEPRRLPFSLVNFNDFVQQALKPCLCGNKVGADGLVIAKLDHITNDAKKGGMLVLELAIRNKHVVAEDGICLSCCHPATKKLLGRAD